MGWGLFRVALGLVALGGAAGAQSMLGAPPARPEQAAPTRPVAPAPPQAQGPRPASPNQAPPGQARPNQAPPRAASQPPRPATPQQGAPRNQAQRPQGQQARPGQAPARRAPAAAAGAAAAGGAAAATAAPEPPAEPPIPPRGAVTNLPTPRFVPLRWDRVNLRVGPGSQFPIEWRYERRDLPVMVIREHGDWRRIRDVDGTEGWVRANNLQPGKRTFLARNPDGPEVPLRRRADAEAPVVARMRNGVIGRIRGCEAGPWCEVQAGETRGWVLRSQIFGVLPEDEGR